MAALTPQQALQQREVWRDAMRHHGAAGTATKPLTGFAGVKKASIMSFNASLGKSYFSLDSPAWPLFQQYDILLGQEIGVSTSVGISNLTRTTAQQGFFFCQQFLFQKRGLWRWHASGWSTQRCARRPPPPWAPKSSQADARWAFPSWAGPTSWSSPCTPSQEATRPSTPACGASTRNTC